jgi:hypothetical protein
VAAFAAESAPVVVVSVVAGLGEFEGAVLDELRVESAVGAEIDVLEEDAELGGGDCCSGVSGVNGDDCGLLVLAQCGDRRKREEQGREVGSSMHWIGGNRKRFR